MHIPPFDNANRPIVDLGDPRVPLNYFNIVKLQRDQSFTYRLPGYESALVPATGSVDADVAGEIFTAIGQRVGDVWGGEPEGLYVPSGVPCTFTCRSATAEVFIAGAAFDHELTPFAVRAADIDLVQYGSDETKTHRKIKHILGGRQAGQVGRLLVSELFTVGEGGWSGFPPHSHQADRRDDSGHLIETRHDETYNFRFKPNHGFALQLLQKTDGAIGEAYHIVDGSTLVIDQGFHPCVVAPGYQMYYFTILGGLSQRPLVQYFQPDHAWQLETIPGIKDMIAKFK